MKTHPQPGSDGETRRIGDCNSKWPLDTTVIKIASFPPPPFERMEEQRLPLSLRRITLYNSHTLPPPPSTDPLCREQGGVVGRGGKRDEGGAASRNRCEAELFFLLPLKSIRQPAE